MYDLLVHHLKRPEIMLNIYEGNPGALLNIAAALSQEPNQAALVSSAQQQAITILEKRIADPNASAHDIGSLAMMRFAKGDYAAAAALYQRALSKNYNEVTWRVARARALLRIGDLREATAEARVAQGMAPDDGMVKLMLRELEETSNNRRRGVKQ
jgi:Flp pilus assembly protein TadD